MWFASYAAIKAGDTFCPFFWTQSASGDTAKTGCYGVAKIESQIPATDGTSYPASFRLTPAQWWLSIVAKGNPEAKFFFSTAKPDSIDLCAGKFSAIPWLHSIAGKTNTAPYSIRFLFPVLPTNIDYGRYDYFTVRFNDTMDVHFQGINDSVMAGSFVNRRVPGSKTIIYAKNAIAVQTTARNSLRIKSIQIDGAYEKLVSTYLRFDLASLKANAKYYGLNFIDTTVVEVFTRISNVSVTGAPKLWADSSYQVTWAMTNPTNVDRCSLYVSFDSTKTWFFAGKTTGDTTKLTWTAPQNESRHCFFNALAIDKNGLESSSLSPEFSIEIYSAIPVKPPPVSSYSLRGIAIDSTTVRLSWSLSAPADTSVDSIGIRYDVLHYPASMSDPLSTRIAEYSLSDTCDTITNLPPNQSYYFALFVVNAAGIWSDTMSSSRVLVRFVKPLPGQAVTMGIDTQRVFGDSLRVWTQPKLQAVYSDTIDEWNGPQVKTGFIQTSQGYVFRQGYSPPNIADTIAISYRTIPAPFTAYDQRIYQYNIFTGRWVVVTGGVRVDTIRHAIVGVCRDTRLPFMLMIDTSAPQLNRLSIAPEFYTDQQMIVDTCLLADNIENLSIQLLGGPGSQALRDLSPYCRRLDETGRLRIVIPAGNADQCSGLRAYLIVGDGRNTSRINLSEKILRDGFNCDDTIAAAEQWTPLFVTAQPQNQSIGAAVLMSSAYDKKNERIIQWQPGAGTGPEEWLEYTPTEESRFTPKPGTLYWIKSRTDRPIKYGAAIVPALIDTLAIRLNPKGWTDFAIPFHSDLYVGDIFTATRNLLGDVTDSIGLYGWTEKGKSFTTEKIFLPGITADRVLDSVIAGNRPYSAYNSSDDTLTLCIPPDGLAFSPRNPDGPPAKKLSPGPWSILLGTTYGNSVHLSSIYCAAIPSSNLPRWFPVSPSFAPVTIAIRNRANNRLYGHAASGDLAKGGCMFELWCNNTSANVIPVTLYVEKTTGLTPEIASGLYAANDNRTRLQDTLHFSLSPQQSTTQHLIVGTSNYIKQTTALLTSKLSMRIIHGGGTIRIAYTVPYNTRRIDFRLFDLKGRRVWDESSVIEQSVSKGTRQVTKPVAAGLYLIELKATVTDERAPRVMRQKVVYVR
jgi:hypothetical protein